MKKQSRNNRGEGVEWIRVESVEWTSGGRRVEGVERTIVEGRSGGRGCGVGDPLAH